MTESAQTTIYRAVIDAYARSGGDDVPNGLLYREVAQAVGMPTDEFHRREPVGRSGARHSRATRTARFVQQTLKLRGVLERAPGTRGVWRLTEHGKQHLHRIERGPVIVAFSTRLGVAVWADSIAGIKALRETISLVVTSPPYALAKASSRAYGNPDRAGYVDFICAAVEPIIPLLADGASLVLNVGNDVFETGSPARTLLKERLVIALCERFSLHKMDEIIWENPCKPVGPIQYVSKQRVQLAGTYEPLLWFTNNPHRVRSNNQRILQPHTAQHERLMRAGGERRTASYSDGAHKIKPGKYSNVTAGRIARNVWRMSHSCAGQRAYKRRARELGLPAHGAPFPERLPERLIPFLTEEGDLCVDFMSGSQTFAAVAERLRRRWYSIEHIAEYLRGGAERFNPADTWINPDLDRLLGLDSGAQRSLPFRHPIPI